MDETVVLNNSISDIDQDDTSHSSFDTPLYWLSQYSSSNPDDPISTTDTPPDSDFICKWILYWEFNGSRVRIWDVMILVPNVLFMLALAFRFDRARHKFRATNSANFFSFYMLVVVNTVVSLVRCAVSMTVNAALPAGSTTDKILWVIVRFFLLSTELSVIIFALAFGHLDSKSSSRYVLAVTSVISLVYSVSQGTLEIISPDENFYVPSKDYNIFGHGGMVFWFTSSVIFSTIYSIIFVLPWTKLRDRLRLPGRPSFYYYILFLALLNLTQAVGSGLLFYRQACGLCIVDVTTFIYFTLYTPLVYITFLSEIYSVSQSSILFSYKAQVDEVLEDDNVSLPHQLSCSSLKTDSDYIYQNNLLYESTQFESNGTPVNPLYNHSLQSPDSVNGYYDHMSRSNSINSEPGPSVPVSQRVGKPFRPSRLLEEQ
ncbi:hypothetical protein CHUAL_012498 [Chamberlinius hualienensis]